MGQIRFSNESAALAGKTSLRSNVKDPACINKVGNI